MADDAETVLDAVEAAGVATPEVAAAEAEVDTPSPHVIGSCSRWIPPLLM